MFGLFLVFWFLIRVLFISFRFLFSLQFLFRFLLRFFIMVSIGFGFWSTQFGFDFESHFGLGLLLWRVYSFRSDLFFGLDQDSVYGTVFVIVTVIVFGFWFIAWSIWKLFRYFGLLYMFGLFLVLVLDSVYVYFVFVFHFSPCLVFYFEYCDSIVFQIVVLSCFHSRSHLIVFNVFDFVFCFFVSYFDLG